MTAKCVSSPNDTICVTATTSDGAAPKNLTGSGVAEYEIAMVPAPRILIPSHRSGPPCVGSFVPQQLRQALLCVQP